MSSSQLFLSEGNQRAVSSRAGQTYAHGDDGVDLDFDTSLFDPLDDLEYIVNVGRGGPVFRATLFDIGLYVK